MSGQREATEALRVHVAEVRRLDPGQPVVLTYGKLEAILAVAAAVERVLDLCDEADAVAVADPGDNGSLLPYSVRAALLGES